MSDRIDELVARVRRDMEGVAIIGMVPGHAYRAITELATIAREAEARALKAEAERDALLAEHEAVAHLNHYLAHAPGWEPQERLKAAYDNAERMIRDE